MLSFPGRLSHARLLRSVVPLLTEVPKLVVLVLLTAAGFAGTRAVAAHERRQQLRDAAEWRLRGQEALARGRPGEAIAAFRRAVTKDRENRVHAAGLATALAADGQLDQAERVLIDVRDRAPDDTDLNLQLAQVEARRGDSAAAVRFYRNALYAPWRDPTGSLPVRLELAEFLLNHGRQSDALSELIAALTDAGPDAVDVRRRIGGLLLRAGDPTRALRVFQEVLTRTPDDAATLAGAGTAAFDLGRYGLAATYLRGVNGNPEVEQMRTLAEMVIGLDPLAPRLGTAERRRRATANLLTVTSSMQACRAAHDRDEAADTLDSSMAEATGAEHQLRSADRDVIEESLSIIARAEQTLARYCGQPPPAHRALLIIARLHGETP